MARIIVAVVALVAIGLALVRLEGWRSGLEIADALAGETPVTVYRLPDSDGPAVVVAHGFAGSRQLMEAWSLTLARAGYQVAAFDFLGHGRNPVPMSGDVTVIEGTTQRLVDQTRAVIDLARDLPGAATAPVALLGHSMASDVIVRAALDDPAVGPVVAISAFSGAVSDTEPGRLLLITGAWEPGLREAGLRYLRMVDPSAEEGDTATAGEVVRRAVVAPSVEHVGVLYSATGLAEARAWLDDSHGRSSAGPVAATGGWIALLLAGCVALAWPLMRALPAGPPPPPVPLRLFLAGMLGPALLTPLLLAPFETRFLPVLVADYLALHLLVYGALALAILGWGGARPGPLRPWPTLALLAVGLGVFGLALDRYAASFVPIPVRWPIVAAIALGAVPFMLGDAVATEAGRAALWRRWLARIAFLASLGIAVALDFERLFFLVMILPVIVLFFGVFGTMGGWAGRRTGAASVPGIALGLILAWAIGVSFPLFAA
jgi:hypothetical protein